MPTDTIVTDKQAEVLERAANTVRTRAEGVAMDSDSFPWKKDDADAFAAACGALANGALALLSDRRARIVELRRERKKNQNSLGRNLCPDHRDKQAGKPCLACEIERLEAALDAADERGNSRVLLDRESHQLRAEIARLRAEIDRLREAGERAGHLLARAFVQLSDHINAVEESGHAADCAECKELLGEIEQHYED